MIVYFNIKKLIFRMKYLERVDQNANCYSHFFYNQYSNNRFTHQKQNDSNQSVIEYESNGKNNECFSNVKHTKDLQNNLNQLVQNNRNCLFKLNELKSKCRQYKSQNKRQILKKLDQMYRVQQKMLQECTIQLMVIDKNIENMYRDFEQLKYNFSVQKFEDFIKNAKELECSINQKRISHQIKSLNIPFNLEFQVVTSASNNNFFQLYQEKQFYQNLLKKLFDKFNTNLDNQPLNHNQFQWLTNRILKIIHDKDYILNQNQQIILTLEKQNKQLKKQIIKLKEQNEYDRKMSIKKLQIYRHQLVDIQQSIKYSNSQDTLNRKFTKRHLNSTQKKKADSVVSNQNCQQQLQKSIKNMKNIKQQKQDSIMIELEIQSKKNFFKQKVKEILEKYQNKNP